MKQGNFKELGQYHRVRTIKACTYENIISQIQLTLKDPRDSEITLNEHGASINSDCKTLDIDPDDIIESLTIGENQDGLNYVKFET